MSVVGDLVAVYGYYARFLTAPSLRLPDGTVPVRGAGFEDTRDLEKLAHAGLLASYLHRLKTSGPPGVGSVCEAVLRAYFSRAGQANHILRLDQAIADLEHQGIITRRAMTDRRRREIYLGFLNDAIDQFAAARRAVLRERNAAGDG